MPFLLFKKTTGLDAYRADLHCHSTCSDGTHTPEELLMLAKEKGLSALSITDHDILDAYTEAFFKKSERVVVTLYMGVEFSSRYQNFPIHILGHGVKKTEESLTFCQKHRERREKRNQMIFDRFKRLGIMIEKQELSNCPVIGRPHNMANVLLKKGYVSFIQEAFDRYLGEGKRCFIPGETFSPEATIHVIHQAGGGEP